MRNRSWVGLPIAALLVLSACTLWPEHVAKDWRQATGGESLERIFWNDVKAKNWTDLETHLAGNYIYAGPEGRRDKASSLTRLQQWNLEDYSLGDVQVEMNGVTLVVHYTISLRGTRNGQPLPTAPIRMLGVWQQQKAGWIAITHTVIVPADK